MAAARSVIGLVLLLCCSACGGRMTAPRPSVAGAAVPSGTAIRAFSKDAESPVEQRNLLVEGSLIKFEPGDMLHVRLLSSSQLFKVHEGNRIEVLQPLYIWNSAEGVLLSRDGVHFDVPSFAGFPRASIAFAPKKQLNLFFIWLDPWVSGK